MEGEEGDGSEEQRQKFECKGVDVYYQVCRLRDITMSPVPDNAVKKHIVTLAYYNHCC